MYGDGHLRPQKLLKLAYLWFHLSDKLLQYQLEQYNGQAYCVSRLDSRLNSVLKILTTVPKSISGKVDRIRRSQISISVTFSWTGLYICRISCKICEKIQADCKVTEANGWMSCTGVEASK